MRTTVLILRVIMGVGFAFLLSRFFFPHARWYSVLSLAGLLVLAAYLMEALRTRKE